ncbi:UNKNOWN [Stylonychia lemnae]|uniref:Morn repeat protein n=1 Tax=Stylonychia lemnae TaxID=5949 RepID=A0A078A2Q6_STYLE|nr:UNKNOWN [Stylonychia lemnae]|eukprot:CDW76380.1 UNKNOWN [Stylonychia lemnae]
MQIDVEDDQMMKIYQNNTTNFAAGTGTPPHSDGGSNFVNETQDQMSQQSIIINYNFLEEYVPESKEINIEFLRSSQIYKKKRYVDAIYFGEIIETKRQGKGVMKYKSGRVYEGDWFNDLRSGRGFEKYHNGNVYLGAFDCGKAHGQGKYTWNNNLEVYDGQWVRGVRRGYGMWKNIKGDSYIGEWDNGRALGYGVFTWANGDKYEGEWANSLKHGKGTDLFINGDSYRGEYKFGKPDGFGVYTWANGSVYEGNFKNGLKCGKGKWRKAPEVIGGPTNEYAGEYKGDKKCGQGEFFWASGNHYKGEYQDDERNGYGEMTWTDGSKYIGQWFKGIQHGYGKMIFPDGTFKEGYFDNNAYVGHVPSKTMLMKDQMRSSIYQTPSKNGKGSLIGVQSKNGQLTDQKSGGYNGYNNGGVMNKRLGSNKSNRLLKQSSDPNQYNILQRMSNEALQHIKHPQSIISMSNGFLSTQKLQNRAGISPSQDQKTQQFNLLNQNNRLQRDQSLNILRQIQKPIYEKVNSGQNSLEDSNENASHPSAGRRILARSKKSINGSSHKILPRGSNLALSGTRFMDGGGYHHLTPSYNLGLN